MMLVTPLVLLLAQAPDTGRPPTTGGSAILALCAEFDAADPYAQDGLACLSYAAGLVDAIAYYEGMADLLTTFDNITRERMLAHFGALSKPRMDELREMATSSNEWVVKTATEAIRLQEAAVARGATKVLPPDLPNFRSLISQSICFPKGMAGTDQVALVIIKFVRDHPERMHEGRSTLAIAALKAAFPCADDAKP